MKRYMKSIGSMLLCLLMVFSSGIPVYATDQLSATDTVTYADEKIFCDATIEDDFADDRV